MKNVSIKDLHHQTSPVLHALEKDTATALTDPSGRPQAYLIDSATFDHLRSRIHLLEGIARGERAIEEGRVLTQTQARKRMARWLKTK